MATPGTLISLTGHTGLMLWLIVGWGFNAEPLEITTMDVTVISGEEFEQMRARSTPEPGTAEPDAPVPRAIDETPPVTPAIEEPAEVAPPPDPVVPPESETPPPPPPEPLVTEAEDIPPPPPVEPVAPPTTPEVDVSPEATPPQAPTVASTITAPPPPDATIAEVPQEAVVPDDSAEAEIVQEEREAEAPEETTTAIVIEDLAPTTSVRPVARPSRPAPVPPLETEVAIESPTPNPSEPETSEEDVAAALEAALAEANETTVAPSLPLGQGLSASERGSFLSSISRKWVVDSGAESARITVTVLFRVDVNRRILGEIELISSSEGSEQAQNAAFRAAQRAILRAAADGGLELPVGKFEAYDDFRITFDPSSMRLR